MNDDDKQPEYLAKRKKSTRIKKRLLKKEHTHAGVHYPIGTPLENLKASDTTIAFLEKRDII